MKVLGWQKRVGHVASPLHATSRVHGINGQDKPSFVLCRGWMPRQKSCWPPVVGKLFLLTSPFREHRAEFLSSWTQSSRTIQAAAKVRWVDFDLTLGVQNFPPAHPELTPSSCLLRVCLTVEFALKPE